MKFFVMLGILSSIAFSLTHLEVAQKSEAVMSGFKDSVAEMKMELINAAGETKSREMKMMVLEGKEDKSLMEFKTPSDVKGTKFLSYEHIDKEDDQWLYLPALKRVKRIASKAKSGAFMGSEFAYEDLSGTNVEKYNYTQAEAPTIDMNGVLVYKSIASPRSKDSGYTKLVSYIDIKTFLVKKIEYFDRKNEILKVAYFDNYRAYDGVYRASQITMKNLQNGKSTRLIWSSEKIKNGLKESDFHQRHLK